MPEPNATLSDSLLSGIHSKISGSTEDVSGILDFANTAKSLLSGINETNSAAAQSLSGINSLYDTLNIFSALVATGATTTGAIATVNSTVQSILVDIDGNSTAVTLTLRAGLSGVGFVTLRVETASAGTYLFPVGDGTLSSGATAGTTGVQRFDELFLQVNNANGGAAPVDVTVIARAFLAP